MILLVIFCLLQERQAAENDYKTIEALINGSRTKIRHDDRELQSSEAVNSFVKSSLLPNWDYLTYKT